MRWWSFIFAAYVLIVAIHPCCAGDACKNLDGCEATAEDSDHKEGCSPFFSCGTCAGFIVPSVMQTAIHLVLPPVEPMMHSFDVLATGFPDRIWQPPNLPVVPA